MEKKSSKESRKTKSSGKTLSETTITTSASETPSASSSKSLLELSKVPEPKNEVANDTHIISEGVIVLVRKKPQLEPSVPCVYQIVPFTGEKPNFGGFRDTRTDINYYHASCQTPVVIPVQDPSITLECRESQTIEVHCKWQQSNRDNSTQMTKLGVYVSTANDKVITSKRYVTADEYIRMYLRKVVIVQKQVRCFLAKKRVQKLRENREEHLRWLQMQIDLRHEDKREKLEDANYRKQYPRSKSDFNMLYNAVEKWRQEKALELEKSVNGPELKAALYLLGEKESKLLSLIHQHKLVAQEANKLDRFRTSLARTSAAKKWRFGEGRAADVYTLPILRSKQFQELYQTLTLDLSEDERLDTLITLKETVKNYDCEMTREIMDLADREADLLVRGLSEKNLAGLRQRLLVLYMQFIRTPLFNPAFKKPSEKFSLKKQHDKSVCQSKNICQSCGWLYSINKFIVPGNTSLIRRCHHCAQQENEAIIRNDDSVFSHMLNKLRIEEGKLKAKHSVAFIMELKDFRHLVEVIWGSQSAMSAETDLYTLVMCRWFKEKEWSPWNCILLTSEEAVSHFKVKFPMKTYNLNLIDKVKKRHLLAKNYFNQIRAATRRFKTL